MAFADPQSVTVNAVAQTLPRTPTATTYGVFTKDDGSYKLTISRTNSGKRTRHLARLDSTKTAADPLMAGVNVLANMGVYLVIDVPRTGYTLAEQKQIVEALTGFLTASSGANVTKILGGES